MNQYRVEQASAVKVQQYAVSKTCTKTLHRVIVQQLTFKGVVGARAPQICYLQEVLGLPCCPARSREPPKDLAVRWAQSRVVS